MSHFLLRECMPRISGLYSRHVIAAVAATTVCVAAARGAAFIPLGDLTGGDFDSRPFAISGDGTVVVGVSKSEGNVSEAFRWTLDSGMQGLGHLGYDSDARAVSTDGSVVVGRTRAGSGFEREAFRWTKIEGMVGLGALTGTSVDWSMATDVSGDGSVVVGLSLDHNAPHNGPSSEAFRWTIDSGIQPLDVLQSLSYFPRYEAQAQAVSEDGSIIAGDIRGFIEDPEVTAWRWTEAEGVVDLGRLPRETRSLVYDMSSDGETIVGTSRDRTGSWQPYRWSKDTGKQPLDGWSGSPFRVSVSGNGSVVVGGSFDPPGAWIWDAQNGVQDLQSVLSFGYGLASDLDGWTLTDAQGVSDDGLRVVGSGQNPQGQNEAWFVILDSPLKAGDADRDHDFDQLDLVQVQVAGKFLSVDAATWGEGDWNGAPGGSPDSPPQGDGFFNQLDIVAAQQVSTYLTGPYIALRRDGERDMDNASNVYRARTAQSTSVRSFRGGSPLDVVEFYVPVPEPSGIGLLTLGLVATLWRSRRLTRSPRWGQSAGARINS